MTNFKQLKLDDNGMSIGCDPELFVKDGENRLIPAYKFLPTKDAAPKKTAFYNLSSFYWDGFQAEFKFENPGGCLEEFQCAIQNTLYDLNAAVKEYNKDAKLTLDNVVRVPVSTLRTADDIHVALGCMPSINAYGLMGNIVDDPRKLLYRFAGGHIHLGIEASDELVQTLDSILGIWAVGVARNLDSPIRRQYYGLAGEYRAPTYKRMGCYDTRGTEYRVLSNFWLATPPLYYLTFEIARQCVRLYRSNHHKLWNVLPGEVPATINKCDVKHANSILKRNEDMFRWIMGARFSKAQIDPIFGFSYNGLEEFVKNPHDLQKNWKLEERALNYNKFLRWRDYSHELKWEGLKPLTDRTKELPNNG